MKTTGKSECPPRRHAGRQAAQSGLSLMEVLTATVVLAVGASGLGVLQAGALRDGREALQRTEAIVLAADMLERVRANPGGGHAAGLGDGPGARRSCIFVECDPRELAEFDVATWKCRLGAWTRAPACDALRAAGALLPEGQAGLPEGDGAVAVEADGRVRVTVTWRAGVEVGRELVVASRI